MDRPRRQEPGAGLGPVSRLCAVASYAGSVTGSGRGISSRRSTKRNYPYDIAYIRWAATATTRLPEPAICEFVKDWNATHAWPQLVISSTSEAFRAMEKRYGDKLPRVRGDWTPYWEDGAGSSAAETAMNRASSERLAQAETLWAMLDPTGYPPQRFEEAWNNVLLYSEHTWGTGAASRSRPIRSPRPVDHQAVLCHDGEHAVAAIARRSRPDAVKAFSPRRRGQVEKVTRFDVFNTSSWPRSELVLVPREITQGSFCR